MVGRRQFTPGGDERVLEALLAGGDVAALGELLAKEMLRSRTGARADRAARLVEQGRAVLRRQVRDGTQIVVGRLRQPGCRRVAMQQLEDPTGGEVVNDQRQLGEG